MEAISKRITVATSILPSGDPVKGCLVRVGIDKRVCMIRAISSSSSDTFAGKEIGLVGDAAIHVEKEEKETSKPELKSGVPRMKGEQGESNVTGPRTGFGGSLKKGSTNIGDNTMSSSVSSKRLRSDVLGKTIEEWAAAIPSQSSSKSLSELLNWSMIVLTSGEDSGQT